MDPVECPICFELRHDVEVLQHASAAGRNVSSHRACGACRQEMLHKGQSCPWCRDEVVWREVLGFLDTLKLQVGGASSPNQLADLMTKWEEYERTRTRSDVLLFARDMATDVAITSHLDRAILTNAAWLRDSIGLWARFHALVQDGELELDATAADRLRKACASALSAFAQDGGRHAHHGGAMYAQVAVALLCAVQSQNSTATLAEMARAIAKTCVQFWAQQPHSFRERCPREYAEAVSPLLWPSADRDELLCCMYGSAHAARSSRTFSPTSSAAADKKKCTLS